MTCSSAATGPGWDPDSTVSVIAAMLITSRISSGPRAMRYMPTSITVKRLYEAPAESDGTRILVDRLWPRGVRRTDWPEGSWRPELAPSAELRKWYRHDPARFDEFARRYREELSENDHVRDLLALPGRVTLVTAARNAGQSHAAVLADHLRNLCDQAC